MRRVAYQQMVIQQFDTSHVKHMVRASAAVTDYNRLCVVAAEFQDSEGGSHQHQHSTRDSVYF